MKPRTLVSFLVTSVVMVMAAQGVMAKKASSHKAQPRIGRYPLTWSSLPHWNVPHGQTFTFELKNKTIFPDTRRIITVYVPAEYKATKPAAVMVSLDGWGPSTVCDNLIFKKQMPIIIGIGVSCGVTPPAGVGKLTTAQYQQMVSWGPVPIIHGSPMDPRWNRSFEFDGVNNGFVHFLMRVVLPAVEKHRTPSGLPIILTDNPNDRAITGGSSGGIGAFTAAWMNPNAFRRVNTVVGTFVDMRGGNWYPPIIRKSEPEPLRIFMQSGSHDDWPAGPQMGSWPLGNLALEHALKFAGYSVQHVWGTGGHNGNQEQSILPHAMRWLWKNWRQPVKPGKSSNPVLQAMLIPGKYWRVVATGLIAPGAMAVNQRGQVFFANRNNGKIFQIMRRGAPKYFATASPGSDGMAFGPGGRLYVTEPTANSVVAFSPDGQRTVIAQNIHGLQLVVTARHDLYVAGRSGRAWRSGTIWFIRPGGKPIVVANGLKPLAGLILRPDDQWLCVARKHSHFGYSFQVRLDGTLRYREPYYWFEHPPWADGSGTHELTVDHNGWIYAATNLGVQVLDRSGRVSAILRMPGGRPVRGVCFGGKHFDNIFVTCGRRIYKRKLKVRGIPNWHTAISLPVGLGTS